MSQIVRPYTQEQVNKLRGSWRPAVQWAEKASAKLRTRLGAGQIRALGAMTGCQAVQQVKAGLQAVYLSGWQVAADANGHTYPDQSLYPCDRGPLLAKQINNALQRADQIEWAESNDGRTRHDYFCPIVADCEAGFGGPLNAYELAKAYIEAGAAGLHFEDQLASAKKCGHLGGKVLIPASWHVKNLVAARLAADVLGVDTVIIARTDAMTAKWVVNDFDGQDNEYITGRQNEDGFESINGCLDMAIERALIYAPHADMLWCETPTPSIADAKKFADAVHAQYPGKWLAYNCSPSFNWEKLLTPKQCRSFLDDLAEFGYNFAFVTLAGFHSLNHAMYELATDFQQLGMLGYSVLQREEIDDESFGYTGAKHQREVGTGYFDLVLQTIGSGNAAMPESTEAQQFGGNK